VAELVAIVVQVWRVQQTQAELVAVALKVQLVLAELVDQVS
jgi:hypothetical protein